MEYDPWRPEVLADPYEHYRWLRDEHPQYATGGFRVLSRYDDVTAALRDHRTYSSVDGPSVYPQTGFAFIGEDPPAHTKRRKVGSRVLTKGALARWEDLFSGRARDLIERAVSADEIDVVPDIVDPMITASLADALGIPGADPAAMIELSERTFLEISATEPATASVQTDACAFAVGGYADSIIEERIRSGVAGRGDMVDAVIAHAKPDADGHRLNRFDRAVYVTTFVGPGVETTRDLMSNAFELAARFPDEWQRVLDGDATPASFLEEALRFESPVQGFFRGDTERHERVLVLYAAANRDERAFPDADRFIASRAPNEHVAFGLGIHYCLGATLARMEAAAVFGAVAGAGLRVELGGEGVRTNDALIRGWRSLPIALVSSP